MALQTFNPVPGPSPGTSFKPKIKTLEAEFGDGYTQPTPDGINHIRETVELKWDALTLAQFTAIKNFMVTHKGTQPFLYKPAGFTAAVKFIAKSWSYSLDDGLWKFNASLEQSFSSVA